MGGRSTGSSWTGVICPTLSPETPRDRVAYRISWQEPISGWRVFVVVEFASTRRRAVVGIDVADDSWVRQGDGRSAGGGQRTTGCGLGMRSVHQAATESVAAQYNRMLDALAGEATDVICHLDAARADLLAFAGFPRRSG